MEASLRTPAPDAPAADAEVVLEARAVTKRFGDREALRGVSFEARRGELVAVIGPNGAGKTTLLSILAGNRKPDAGEVASTPSEIGWVPQQPAVYGRLTVEENLRLFARLEKVPDPEAAVEAMLEQMALGHRRHDQVGTLSGGNQQRVNIGIGLLASPAVLLLDEPSAALDPRQRVRLWDFVLSLAGEGTTVVFATHNIQEAERYGHRMLVLADAEAVFDGTATALRAAASEADSGSHDPRDFEQAFVEFLHSCGH